MIEIFNQKFVKDILTLVFENSEGMFFTDIQDKLTETYGGIHQSAVSRAISTLFQNRMIEKLEVRVDQKNIPKSFYRITETGKFAFKILEMDKELDEEVKGVKFHNEIKGDVGQVINIDKADGLEINFKKGK
ncbi:PadR family transcriptional regulator [Methanococcus maripaludis]|uniref:DNA-binding HxlR family transcriptional regulator n=1 Tax=Methanococcus maripaludis TaxID=39152 RepID=A0A7J9SBM7_METMI|nr:PadR family transcriptional regulator [Methanococcus maripaludis]MBB6497311.1 DNA-binding HxlR family transcriptional regulator [Methanococcus maripaludis]